MNNNRLNIQISVKQEYDDNNYFDAEYICSVANMSVDWGSWHTEHLFPDLVKRVEELLPSNAYQFITESDGSESVIKQVEDLKDDKEFKYDPEMVDLAIHCLKNKIALSDAVAELQRQRIH